MQYRFRPIDVWPGEMTRQRKSSPFYSSYMQTLEKLEAELRHLRARDVVIQLDLDEGQIRLDGLPRAGAQPGHPGVILAFDSVHGPLKYATDVFVSWADNLRAIALGLEALRRVERYGITKRGEQYTGWKALGSGIPMAAATPAMSLDDAAWFLVEHAHDMSDPVGAAESMLAGDAKLCERLYREAAKTLHPDVGGDDDLFKLLTEARDLLLEETS